MKMMIAHILAAFLMVRPNMLVSGGMGSYLSAPNGGFETQSAPVRQASTIGCGQAGEVEGATTEDQYRAVYEIAFEANSGSTISFSTCNHSAYDTGLSVWEWDPTTYWSTTSLTKIADNDNGGGCLTGSTVTFNGNLISSSKCYFIMIGGGYSNSQQQFGEYDIKMGCGSGTNSYPTTCTTPSPTPSPTDNPTVNPTLETMTPCCITHSTSHQGDCEAEWDDQTGCEALESGEHGNCVWWDVDDGTCDLCCIPRHPNNANDVATCSAVSTEAGCTSGKCYWSGMDHCNE